MATKWEQEPKAGQEGDLKGDKNAQEWEQSGNKNPTVGTTMGTSGIEQFVANSLVPSYWCNGLMFRATNRFNSLKIE